MTPNQLCEVVNKIDQKVRDSAEPGAHPAWVRREVAEVRAAIERAEKRAIEVRSEGARMAWVAKATALRDMLDAALEGAL
jgi:hypothetical protein